MHFFSRGDGYNTQALFLRIVEWRFLVTPRCVDLEREARFLWVPKFYCGVQSKEPPG